MSIESDARHDLELSSEEAENVSGGHKAAKKKAVNKAAPAAHGVLVVGAPLSGDPTPNPVEAQAELESDPDC